MKEGLRLGAADIERLKALSGAEVAVNEPMSIHTTYRLGGPADYFLRPEGAESFRNTLRWASKNGVPYMVIGAGSNLLVSDKGIRGLVICTSGLKRWNVDGTTLYAEAGVFMPALSAALADSGYQGFTEACGIPGSVGGGLYMNAGAYGWRIEHVTRRVICADRDGLPLDLDREAMRFGIKSSALMCEGHIALSIEAELKHGSSSELKAKARALLADRAMKQPLEQPNAGCAFKNPSGSGAGRLIDACGLKGMAIGGAVVSSKHANFIISTPSATAADVKSLMDEIWLRVYERFGERLEPEIRLVGEWDAE